MKNQQNQKHSQADNSQKDPNKDLVPAAGQGQREGNQQSGAKQSGSRQSGQQQMGQQGNQQQGGQHQGSQQSGQHASGGTPALDDLDGKRQGESARQAADAFKQQDQQRGKR